MNTQPEAVRLIDELVTCVQHRLNSSGLMADAAAELQRLHALNYEMLKVLKELQESASYWSEYDVPLGIVDRINAAISKAEGK